MRSARLPLLLGIFLSCAGVAAAETNVHVVADGPWDRNAAIWSLFRAELESLLGSEFDLAFTDDDFTEADWTVVGVRRAVDAALNDPTVDAVIGLGVLASQELCRRGPLPKPSVAPFILDPEVQGVPLANGRSGVRNLSYITSVGRVQKDFATFQRVVPFERMAFLTTSVFVDAIPELPDRTREHAAAAGITASIHAIDGSAADALAAIPADAQAVYVAPLLRFPDAEFQALVDGLIERKLPSFSLFGHGEVRRGLLVGSTPDSEMGRRARRTALNLQRMLLGEDGGTLPVHFSEAERLALNMRTARAIGIRPTWSVITEADLIDQERTEVGRALSFSDMITEAVIVNRDLVAADAALLASAENVPIAGSTLLPQVRLSALATFLDPEVVEASFGQAERQVSGAVTVSQLLLSDGAWAGLSIERRQQLVRELTRETLRLDVAQSAARAYLNVLRARTAERIQRENLSRTQANLELARIRGKVGFSSPGEVYRWEGEIATQRRDLIHANAQRNVAELEINRVLHRPVEESFSLRDVDLADAGAGLPDARVRAFLEDPWSFGVFRAFLEQEAVRKSPEIRGLDAAMAAQERARVAAGRSFWVPTLAAEAEWSHVFGRYGDGAEPDPTAPFSLNPPESTWQVGLRATLPLLEGGARLAKRRQTGHALTELARSREALVERIQQRVRAAAHRAGASYAGIELSRDAADAAERNLSLVRDAYSQGAVSILGLLDAQNAALTAEGAAATAVFDFLLDLAEVQRALGGFFCTHTEGEYEDFVSRLLEFRDRWEDSE